MEDIVLDARDIVRKRYRVQNTYAKNAACWKLRVVLKISGGNQEQRANQRISKIMN